jgi:hypothetical protein
MRSPQRTAALTFGAVPAGVVIGHWLAYLVAVPAAERASFFATTGHVYWKAAIASATVLGAAAAVRTMVGSLRRGLRRAEPVGTVDRFLHLLPRISLLQVAIFVVQEALERLLAGAPIHTMLHDDILVVGILLQLAVAAVLALVLTLLGRAAEAIGRAVAPATVRLRREVRTRPAEAHRAASLLFRGAHGGRAPPATIVMRS